MSAACTVSSPFLFEPDNRTPVTVMLDPATAARLEVAMAKPTAPATQAAAAAKPAEARAWPFPMSAAEAKPAARAGADEPNEQAAGAAKKPQGKTKAAAGQARQEEENTTSTDAEHANTSARPTGWSPQIGDHCRVLSSRALKNEQEYGVIIKRSKTYDEQGQTVTSYIAVAAGPATTKKLRSGLVVANEPTIHSFFTLEQLTPWTAEPPAEPDRCPRTIDMLSGQAAREEGAAA